MGNITDRATLSLLTEILDKASGVFGISPDILAIIISAFVIITASISAFVLSRSITITMACSSIIAIVLTFMGFMLFWFCALCLITNVCYIAYYIYYSAEPSTEATPSCLSMRENSYWSEYGNKLKLAYASKFGGENTGFNQEVDSRIAIMEHNGRGFTRTIAKEWLQRIEKFTEAKK